MSILAPLTASPLTRERLAELLAAEDITAYATHLLRWLIWFPLLSIEEIVRLEQARLAEQGKTRGYKMIAKQLARMQALDLVKHVVLNERGWPAHQHRYYLTDTGLYVFASSFQPPLSVPRLVAAYPVERADVIDRLVHLDRHLTLADFATRLFAEGSRLGYPLVSYQQPWVQTDLIFQKRQTLRLDAALLLAHPRGTEHAFYVRVDPNERLVFNARQERLLLLTRLRNLHDAASLRQDTLPLLLVLTRLSRLHAWTTLLAQFCEQRQAAVSPDGAMTTVEQINRAGAFGPIWWTFANLMDWAQTSDPTRLPPASSLPALFGSPASQDLIERFSQRSSFAHLQTLRQSGPLRRTSRPFPSFVGTSLAQEITSLRAETIRDALRGTKAEQREATALLTLALSSTQKDLLFWLAHHPLLTAHQLAGLQKPGTREARGVQPHLAVLSRLGLLVPLLWYGKRPWYERERYLASETALRYLALREGRSVTFYLLPEEDKKNNGPFSIQRGSSGLFAQMAHTHEVYQTICRLVETAQRDQTKIILWKSARESVRWYSDPLTALPMQIRPDAELLYLLVGEVIPRQVLLEYDRATTRTREAEAKYRSYADYQIYTRQRLPPILVVTQDTRAASLIRACVSTVASDLVVVILLTGDIAQKGLLTLFEKPL